MMRGVRPTPEQQEILRRFPSQQIATASGLARETVASGRRGEPVTRVNLRVMLEAVARLDPRPSVIVPTTSEAA